ncbi:phosphotransferase [Mycobacterium sp. DBP42]|uniref:phosphotransferase n=1 Tax=Mycobacterium sp. DBP42 TaxID=2545267 RepID=UPI00110D119A|nr:lipopolysaccharide kinase InaA family protein [Mycobacterium sp. DBP42]TMS54782.1 hypothetical protein E0T84_04265 [Mycobacterium sp. DBP42]
MTTFPTNGDYVQALQNTGMCFRDQELKTGRVELTSLGLPKAISGNFASVFSITGSSGKRYAVKCFTREVGGQNKRYEAIHDVLAKLARPWQVGFDYITQGVLVDGHWHPILRMEWVENSKTLIPWLEQNLGQPDRILRVAEQFAACIDDLQNAGIAHGDLQHGNLLVDTNDRLRLIDYDGMFVPSIRDLGSNELGLANYQHPLRSNTDFAAHLDRFSAWLIYGSLLSLAAHPGLWWTFRQDGDEKLLFGKEDFAAPLAAIKRIGLLGSPHSEVADLLTESLTSSSSLAGVPEFDPARIPLPTGAQASPQMGASTNPSSAWWRDAGTLIAGATPASEQSVQTARLGTGWLRSHEAPLPPVEVVGPSTAAKVVGAVMTAVAILGAVAVGAVLNVLLGSLFLLLWVSAMMFGTWMLWRRSDTVVGRTAARRQVRQTGREVAQQEKRVVKARAARAGLDGDERRAIQALEDQRSKLPKSSTAEYERQSKDLRKQLTTLQTAFNRLDNAKATEAQKQLKALREQHIQTYMASRRIEPGVIHGIGPALVAALGVHGLHTAADIAAVNGTQFRRTGSSSWFTIYGIGPSKSIGIRLWRERVLAAAESSAPQTLPRQQMQALDRKFADQKRQQQVAIDSIAPQLRQIQASVDTKFKALDQEITLKVDAVRLDYRRRRSDGDATVAEAAMRLQSLEDALLDAQRDLARYQKVSLTAYLTS